MTDTFQDRLQQIKDAGQSIINNAESILGNEEYRTELSIIVTLKANEIPEIRIERSFIPETYVNRL